MPPFVETFAWTLGVLLFIGLFWFFMFGCPALLERRFDAEDVSIKKAMSAMELELFARLREAVPEFMVLPKVELQRFVDGLTPTLGALSVDFLVAREDGMAIAVIDVSKGNAISAYAAKTADQKRAIFSKTNVEYVQWSLVDLPTAVEIQHFFFPSPAY